MMTVRRRLLLMLLPALAVMMLAGGIADYWVARASTQEAFDRALASSALAIAAYLFVDGGVLHFKAPAQNVGAARAGSESPLDDGLFRISGAHGEMIAGNDALPTVDASGAARGSFADGRIQGRALRIASVHVQTAIGVATVTVAETRQNRVRTQQVMLFGKLMVDFAELDVMLLLIWIAVYFGLRPLEALRNEVESSPSPRALRRLDETQVPGELRRIVISFNRVLELLSDAAAVQQRFVADAAHQLRTPVAGLLAQLELLLQDSRAIPVAAQLTQMQAGVQQLAHSANQLLALARAEPVSGLHERFAPVALQPLVEAVTVRHIDRADRASIDLGAEAQPASVLGDAWLLEDLLGNLVDNALKYTPAGGHVTVRSGSTAGRPYLEVEDDGPGIPISDRQRVKERFFRRPGSPGIGCGLGLAIVEEIARAHQADFSIEAGVNERGCRMRIRFGSAAA